KHESLKDIHWDNLCARVGKEKLRSLMAGSKLIGLVNWTMLPFMSDIWRKLLAEVFPGIGRDPGRKFFVDLADPEKRTREDILDALRTLSKFQEQVDVILGLNLKEAGQVAEVLGIPGRADPEASIGETSHGVREKLGLSCVVVH